MYFFLSHTLDHLGLLDLQKERENDYDSLRLKDNREIEVICVGKMKTKLMSQTLRSLVTSPNIRGLFECYGLTFLR
jgi:hypothetical protein